MKRRHVVFNLYSNFCTFLHHLSNHTIFKLIYYSDTYHYMYTSYLVIISCARPPKGCTVKHIDIHEQSMNCDDITRPRTFAIQRSIETARLKSTVRPVY